MDNRAPGFLQAMTDKSRLPKYQPYTILGERLGHKAAGHGAGRNMPAMTTRLCRHYMTRGQRDLRLQLPRRERRLT